MSMPKVFRYKLMPNIWMDTGALPCPRCRSSRVKNESHPATGSMATCLDCGARGYLEQWNDGEFHLTRTAGKQSFEFCGVQKFERPATDEVVKVTSGKRAWELQKQHPV